MLSKNPNFELFRICLLLCLQVGLLLYTFPLKGQQQEAATSYDIKWVLLPEVSANRHINSVFQDRYGTLWIGSKSGLYRYDGVNAQAHRISQLDTVFKCPIRAILEDTTGNLWVATENGLKIMDPTRSRLLPFAALNLPASFEKLRKINMTNGPDGSLYLAFGKNIYNYRSKQLTLQYTLPVEDDYDPVLCKYSPNEHFILMNNMPLFARELIVIETNGTIILNPPLYDSKGRRIFNEIIANDDIFFIQNDSLSLFLPYWVKNEPVMISLHYNRARKGFVYWGKENWSVYNSREAALIQKTMQEKKFISTGGFNSINRLAHGIDVYVGQEGLFLLKPKKDYFQPVKASLGKQIRAIQGDRYGHLIYGTYNGTYWQGQEEQQAHLLKGGYLPCWKIQPENTIGTRFFLEYDMDCKYWVYLQGTSKGVSIEQEKALFTFDKKHINSPYLTLATDTQRNGIWHYLRDSEGCFQLMFYNKQEDKHYYLNKICNAHEPRCIIAGKDLWVAGESGIKRFINPDPTSGSLQEDNSSIPDLFKNAFILTLYVDASGQFWICPDSKGLIRYQPETGQYEQFRSNEGLPDNSVYNILGEPGDSVLWLGTGKGLSRFDVKKRLFENYFVEDGLSHNEFNTAAAYRAPDGTMYMGGQNGINRFHPDDFDNKLPGFRQTAQVNLVGATGVADIQQFILHNGDFLQIPSSTQLMQITFHTDDFMHAAQQHFLYRIPGLIDEWQTVDYGEKVLFPYLTPGKHTLEVQTQTYRGLPQTPSRYTLEVLPHWYATWWFRTLLVISGAAVLFGLYLLRIRFLRREFSLRQQISHDLHDELGSRIFLLRTLSHKIANPLLPDAEKQADLNSFEATSQETFKSIRDFIWAFDPKQDEVEHLFDRMDDFAENYLSPIIDTVQIHRSDFPEGIKIGPRVKHHLMNIYQELLTNMVKHTQSEEINISLSLTGSTMTVGIQNRHAGYRGPKPEHKEIQLGQESLQNRLAEINAQLVWEAPGEDVQTVKILVRI